jgi:transposase-like protein
LRVAGVCRRHGIATSQPFRWRVQFGLTARKTPQLATVILADSTVNQVPALSTLRDLARSPDEMTAIVMEIARSWRDGATSSPYAAHSIGSLQRAMARNLAIQLQPPTWHLCWTSVAARSPEDTALSAGASSPSLVRIGPLGIVHEQHREWGTSGSFDEPSWFRSQ